MKYKAIDILKRTEIEELETFINDENIYIGKIIRMHKLIGGWSAYIAVSKKTSTKNKIYFFRFI